MLLPYVVTMFIGATVYLTYQHFTQSQAPDNLIYTTVTRAVEEQTYLSKLVLHKYYTHAIWLNSFYEDIRDNSFIKGIESALHPATQTQNKKSQNGTLKAKKSKRVGRKEMLTYKRYISSFFKALCTTITKKKIRIDNDKDLSSKNGAKTQIPKLKMPHMKSYEEYVSLSFCSSLKNAYDDKNIVFKSAILLSSLKTYFDTLENNDQFATHIVQDKIRDTLLRFKDLKLSKSDDTLRLLSETYSIAATKDEKDVIASHETNLKLDGDKKCFNHHYIDITGILADLLLDYEINLGEENGEKIYQEELDILTRVCTILNTILLSKKILVLIVSRNIR